MPRALLIQLARLGDLVQSLPAISALHSLYPERPLDLLCPAPLVPVGELFPAISNVYPWDSALWKQDSAGSGRPWEERLLHMCQVWTNQAFPAYPMAYNLNNHPRSILVAHLLGDKVVGPGAWGPVNPRLSPWDEYLLTVAKHRGRNRIHLSDAFCGLCEVRPPMHRPKIGYPETEMPSGINCLTDSSRRPIIGLVVGAGDSERRIPVGIWNALVLECVAALPDAWLVLLGGGGEREIALAIESTLPSSCLNRIVNLCGKTSLLQLVAVLSRCQWVVGSDTGPLHLGTACGARAVGWYFARARVHETGPYGAGHYVWQHSQVVENASPKKSGWSASFALPRVWPVRETVQVFLENQVSPSSRTWSLWESQHDELGTYYHCPGNPDDGKYDRRTVWERLSPGLACSAS